MKFCTILRRCLVWGVLGVMTVSSWGHPVSALPGEKPKVNAEGMTLNAFGSVSAGAVDAASGALSVSRTDVELPGRNGMALSVGRTYSSKEFKASPKWSKLDGDAYYNYAGQDLKTLQWQSALPAQWGGWIGNGWRTTISGRLLHIKYETSFEKSDWWGANCIAKDHVTTEMVIIQLPEGSYAFEKETKVTKDGVTYADARYFPRDRGNQTRLDVSMGVKGGQVFVFTQPDGHSFRFTEPYYRKTYRMNYHTEMSMRSVVMDRWVDNVVVGEYLGTVSDVHGNQITTTYEKGPTYDFAPTSESLSKDPFSAAQVASSFQTATDIETYKYYQLVTDIGSWAKTMALTKVAQDNLNGVDLGATMGRGAIVSFFLQALNGGDWGEILGSVVQNTVYGAIQEQVLTMVFQTLLGATPAGWVLSALRFLVDLILADTHSGAIATTLSLTPMRPVQIADQAGSVIRIAYVEPVLFIPHPTTKTETYDDREDVQVRNPATGQMETQSRTVVKTRTVQVDYDFEAESDNFSRIASLSYAGPKGEQVVRYRYDESGRLIEVEKPGHDLESYAYKAYNAPLGTTATAAHYEHQGALLSEVVTNTGAKVAFDYAFIHAKDMLPAASMLTDDEDSRFSSFVLTRRTLSGNGVQAVSRYDGFEAGHLYPMLYRRKDEARQGRERGDEKAQRAFSLSTLTETQPNGVSVTSTFKNGLPTTVRNSAGPTVTTTWEDDTRHKLRDTTTVKGFETTTVYAAYDEYGFPTEIRESGTQTESKVTGVTYERSPAFLAAHNLAQPKSTWVESNGKKVQETMTYDAQGKGAVMAVTAFGATTQFDYDAYGNRVKTIDPNGAMTQIVYDNGVLPLRTVVKDVGFVTEKTYYPNSALVKSDTDVNGNLTRYEYDDRGRMSLKDTQMGASHRTTAITYDDLALTMRMRVTTTGGGQNKTLEGTFNAFGKPTLITVIPDDLAPLTTHYTYTSDTPDPEIESVTDPMNRVTRYRYDERARLTQVTRPDASTLSYDYLDGSNAIAATDALGNRTTYTYDAVNRLIQVRRADFTSAQYAYDGFGNLLHTTDPRGLVTTHTYDEQNRRIGTRFPNGTSVQWTYDALGHVLTQTEANGQTTTYAGYDSQKRPQLVTYSDGMRVRYTYDTPVKGTLSKLSVVGPTPQESTYTYDSLGYLTREDKRVGSDAVSLDYVYDDTGLLLKQRDSIGQVWQETSYDRLGRPIRIRHHDTDIATDFSYEKTGLLQGYTLPQATIRTTYTYDPATDRVTGLEIQGPMAEKAWQPVKVVPLTHEEQFLGTPGQIAPYLSQRYTYDAEGNRLTTRWAQPDLTWNHAYRYDPLNQLIEWRTVFDLQPEQVSSYVYDAGGNRTRWTYPVGGTPITVTTPVAGDSHQITALWTGDRKGQGAWDYAYDANGNRTSRIQKDGTTARVTELYTWNPRNQLTQIRRNGTPVLTNTFDITGMRTHKTAQGISSTFVYDAQQKLLSERIGTTNASVVYLGTTPIARFEQKNNQSLAYYFLNDPLGTPLMTAVLTPDSPTPLLNRYPMDPWGNMVGGKAFLSTRLESVFTGKVKEDDLDLYYFYARFYDPWTMRFVGRDPVAPDLEQPLSLNEYQYCLNNPLIHVDKEGKRTYVINGISNNSSKPPQAIVNFAQAINAKLGYLEVKTVMGIYNHGHVQDLVDVGAEMINHNQYSTQVTNFILNDLKNTPMQKGDVLNLIGYSGGGQIAFNDDPNRN